MWCVLAFPRSDDLGYHPSSLRDERGSFCRRDAMGLGMDIVA